MTESAFSRIGSLRKLLSPLSDWRHASFARNVILNWTSTAVTVLSALITTPIVVRALDKELYGIWSFLNGLLVYSDLLYLGLGSALVKYAAEHLARRDSTGLNRLCSVVFSVYGSLGIISFAVGAVLALYVPVLFASELSAPAVTAVRYTCLLLGSRLLALFVCSVFGGVLLAADRIDLARVVTLTFTLMRTAVVPFIVFAPMPLVALALLVAVSSALETVATAALAARAIHGLRLRLVVPRLPELRPLYAFGLQSFLFLIGVKVISYSDVTVIGLTLGATSVAFYALPLQLAEYGRIVINGIVAILLPRVTALTVRGDPEAVATTYLSAARLSCVVAVLFNVHLVFLGGPFLERWVGPAFARTADTVLFWLACASVLQCLSTQVALPFYQAMNLLKFPNMVLGFEGAVNVALSLALVSRLDLRGVALGTAIPALCISGVLLPRHICRQLHVPLGTLARYALWPAAVIGLCDAALLAALGVPLPEHTYLHIVVRGVAALALLSPALVWVGVTPAHFALAAVERPAEPLAASTV